MDFLWTHRIGLLVPAEHDLPMRVADGLNPDFPLQLTTKHDMYTMQLVAWDERRERKAPPCAADERVPQFIDLKKCKWLFCYTRFRV